MLRQSRIIKILKNRLGQHAAEFLVLFLAVAVAFTAMRFYLRRGVNAKLKSTEIQLNDIMKAVHIEGTYGTVIIEVEIYNINGQSMWKRTLEVLDMALPEDAACGDLDVPTTIDCWDSHVTGCCLTYRLADLCFKWGICLRTDYASSCCKEYLGRWRRIGHEWNGFKLDYKCWYED